MAMWPRRSIPPSAPPLRLRDILRGMSAALSPRSFTQTLAQSVRSQFGVRHVFLVSSGKAALSLILRSLSALSGRRGVVVPAYTCFSVPASIVAAKLELTACDVDPETLDFDYGDLERCVDSDTLAVVPTHLLGLPSRVDSVRAIARRTGAFVIEDAAQAMGGQLDGRSLGTLGDVGFFSLGRGKMLTCGEGGIVLTDSGEIAQALSREISLLSAPSRGRVAADLSTLCAQCVFTHPALYWIPDGVPALGLGRTVYPADFSSAGFSGANAAMLVEWETQLADTLRTHRRNARTLIALLHDAGWLPRPTCADIPYLRLPVLLERAEHKAPVCALGKRCALGVSSMYPTPISAIPQIRHCFGTRVFPGATTVAERLVTLPVHRLVEPADYERLLAGLRSCLGPGGQLQVIAPQPVASPSPHSI
jgi:perosamine synthetase